MKLYLLSILTITFIYGCKNNKKTPNNPNEIIYHGTKISSGVINAEADLEGNITHKELSLQIKLSNPESKHLEIQEIAVSTAEGLHAIPEKLSNHFFLNEGKDTSLTLKFNPFNDYKLYQVTGLHSGFKPFYNIKVLYKVAESNKVLTLSLRSAAEKNQYSIYSKKYIKPITGYSFNTKNGFNEKEKKYLETLKQIPQPPFVFLSDQEIAVSGLNFRLKNYYQKDTLHAELSIVNHADFQVKVVTDALDFTSAHKPGKGEIKTISIEKVSGKQQNLSMIEKGDRVLIHFKKYMKLNNQENMLFTINKAFLIKGNKPLFNENIQLVPNHF
jgi:hypothetical protein